jgi:hypothetical protein
LRWSTVTTEGSRSGSVRRRRVALSVTNYVALGDARPGRHRLRFSLETARRFKVRAVRIRRASGLRPTDEPPYTVALEVDPRVTRTKPNEPFEIGVTVRNTGGTPAKRVGLAVVESKDVVLLDRRALTGWPTIAPKRAVTRRFSMLVRRLGAWKVDVAVDSSKGSDLMTITIIAAARPPPASGGAEGSGAWLLLGGGWLLVVAAAYLAYRSCR